MDEPGHRIRASDTEREQYAKMLRAAMSEGRLNLTEGEERLAKVYATVYRDELNPLTADLPGDGWWALYNTDEFKDRARRLMQRRIAGLSLGAGLLLAAGLLVHPVIHPPIVLLAVLAFLILRRRARWRRYARWNAAPPWAGWGGPWQDGPWQSIPWQGGPWHGRRWHDHERRDRSQPAQSH